MVRSASLSVVSWEANLVKTVVTIRPGVCSRGVKHTETWGKDGDIKVSSKFLHLCCEHSLASYDVTRQADTDHLQDRFEDEYGEMR